MSTKNIAVIGSGMAGFGASYRLNLDGVRPVLYEQSSYFGGHTASFRDDHGFLFDCGPHISYTKDKRIQKLLADWVEQEFHELQVELSNYWHGIRVTHPVQMHLNALPKDLIIEIIADFVKEHTVDRKIANYEDWLVASFGRKFAETFPMTYTRKYHQTTASNMTTEWLGPRMYRPSIEELLRGALAPWKPETHYITDFRYPIDGGFVSYLRDLPKLADLRLEHQLVTVEPKQKSLRFKNGHTASYDQLVTSVPVRDLVPLISGVPRDVLDAAQQLACSSCVLVNVGVNRADLSESHVIYFYDEDIAFTRLSFPHMLSGTNAPPGCGSVQAEVYFSDKYRPLTQEPDSLIEVVVHDLIRSGVLRETDQILTRHTHLLPHANIIFDLERPEAIKTVHGYLDDLGIAYCGRYGEWGYLWTDESFMSGERAAEAVLARQ